MSYVTNVILCYSFLEDEEARLADVNAYFGERPIRFKELTDYAGSKNLERVVLVGAFNYLGVEPFVEHVRNVKWEEPQRVQLFICDQNEELFTERLKFS